MHLSLQHETSPGAGFDREVDPVWGEVSSLLPGPKLHSITLKSIRNLNPVPASLIRNLNGLPPLRPLQFQYLGIASVHSETSE